MDLTPQLRQPTEQSSCLLFRFPRELRDIIYSTYVTISGGYVHDTSRNKLCGTDKRVVNLSLMRTCRKACDEMEGLPWKLNAMTFRPLSTPESMQHAGILHAVICRVAQTIRFKTETHAADYLTGEIVPEVSIFPYVRPLIETAKVTRKALFLGHPRGCLGEAPSIYRDFLHQIFNLLSQNPDFVKKLNLASTIKPTCVDPMPAPWSILSQ